MSDEYQISASFILEILGKPKDYVKETLEKLVDAIDEEKGVSVTEKKIHEPKELEQKSEDSEKKSVEVKKDKLFTTFAEVEADFEDLNSLLLMVFKYMPSHLEVIKPETFVLKNDFLSEMLTGIILRLHRYDEIAKKLVQDNTILKNKLDFIAKKIKESQKEFEKKKVEDEVISEENVEKEEKSEDVKKCNEKKD